ncbi:MAG: tetratricopeptide repeat protein [Candidatus Krumholzibacteriota bacterium]
MSQPAPESTPHNDASPTSAGLFKSGRQAEMDGELEKARQAYEMALASSPDQHPWHYRLGCVFMKLGLPERAEHCFSRALELEPGTPSYLTNLGVCLDRQGRRDEAVRAYRKSTHQEGAGPVAFHNLGAIYAEEGRSDEAIRAFESALALEQDAEGYQNLGLVHYAREDFVRALDCFERSVECDPGFALGHYYAALCLMKSGIYQDACLRFDLAWKLDSRLARIPYYRGTCLHKMERYEEARASLENALEFFPEDGRTHYQIALTCDALGMPQEARLHYSQARAARKSGGHP